MASERPKLPPGCTGPHAVGDYDYDDGMQRVTTYAIRSGHDHFAWGKTPKDASLDAWARFEELFGITRERWEAMERAEAELARVTAERDALTAEVEEWCDLFNDATEAWEHFEAATGITRERWEAMERAVDFVRYYREKFDLAPVDEWPPLAHDAEAILAALDGEGTCL